MRYLKPFFEKINVEEIEKEIGEISYILEDEGYVLEYGVANANVVSINSDPVLWMQIRNVFDKEKLRESDEFHEFIDRLCEIFDKFKINKMETLGSRERKEIGRYYDYSLDNDGLKKYLLLNYRFNKRYLGSLLESKSIDYSEIDNIIEEIKTLSHILQDEGYDINIRQENFKLNQHHLPLEHELYDIAIVIDITPRDGRNVMAVKNEEFYEEWVERLYDICREYKMYDPIVYPKTDHSTLNRIRMVISTKRRIKLKNETYKKV